MNILIEFPLPCRGPGRGSIMEEEKEEYWNYLYSSSVKLLPFWRRQYSSVINMAWLHFFSAASWIIGKPFLTLVSLNVKWRGTWCLSHGSAGEAEWDKTKKTPNEAPIKCSKSAAMIIWLLGVTRYFLNPTYQSLHWSKEIWSEAFLKVTITKPFFLFLDC